MKRTVLFLILIFLLQNTAFAISGDILGNYYFTDIKTYVYNSPITSYNIGGNTMLDAEILNWHYGFDVYWNENERTVKIFDKGGRFTSLQAMSGEICESKGGISGEIAGSYYETDIKTYLNGKEITSCNIGGRTCISVEEMAKHGYEITWNESERTLRVNKPADFYKLETNIGTVKTIGNTKTQNQIKTDKALMSWYDLNEKKFYSLEVPSGEILWKSMIQFVKLNDIAKLTNGKAELAESMFTSHSVWINGRQDYDTEFNYKINLTFDKIPYIAITEHAIRPADAGVLSHIPVEYNEFEYDFYVNGKPVALKSIMGGKEYNENFILYNGEIYIPSYTAGKILFLGLNN